ncbi:hypothetical protein AMS68_006352 [Peltaster fructicola]|uniref:Isochorismatase-like domain-containing protein n=1 Tax=Peltaster fructicola TaxID=286661 RepID=A0A6H0Y1P2_9PEZI|nr:hypothetical protein AMS68_006352 [Peltaster fructicola]
MRFQDILFVMISTILFSSSVAGAPVPSFHDIEKRWIQGETEKQIHANHDIRSATPAWPIARDHPDDDFSYALDKKTSESRRGRRADGVYDVVRRFVGDHTQMQRRSANDEAPVLKPKKIMRESKMSVAARRLTRPALFVCDLQEKFRPAIYEFAKVVSTTQKLLKASAILDIPVFATTQLRAKLGETCPELELDAPNGIKTHAHCDKSKFSMWTPEVQTAFQKLGSEKRECIIVGIESHICVTQTTLDLLREGHRVYVIADGVSSCNPEEKPIALARLRAEGATVTTSESFLYELMGDATIPEFKSIASVVKESSASTKENLQALCKI